MKDEQTEEELPGFPNRGSNGKKRLSGTATSAKEIVKNVGLPKSAGGWLAAVAVLGFAYSQFSSFTKTIADVAKSSVESEFVRRENETLKTEIAQCKEEKKQIQWENQKLQQKIDRLELELKQDNWWKPNPKEKLK